MTSAPFRIAVITTEYRPLAHADVIVSRWLQPYPTDEKHGWGHPRTQIASIYTAQCPPNDMAAEICRKHDIPRFATVEGALTLGGDRLAVDAVLLIAEHGEYPENEFRQKLYPRRELFEEVVAVFRKEGRVLPLFFDKHFSWNPVSIKEMYAVIDRWKIPFLGGTSLTHFGMEPQPALPEASAPAQRIDELVAIYYDSLEAYLFHSLEVVEKLLEEQTTGYLANRTGVAEIVAWSGADVWKALDEGLFSADLLEAAAGAVSPESAELFYGLRSQPEAELYAFQLRYRDGSKITHVMQKGTIKTWTLGWRIGEKVDAARVRESGGAEEFYGHFARLNRVIEDFFLSGEMPIPVERLYVTSLATALCMRALGQPGVPMAVEDGCLPVLSGGPAPAIA